MVSSCATGTPESIEPLHSLRVRRVSVVDALFRNVRTARRSIGCLNSLGLGGYL